MEIRMKSKALITLLFSLAALPAMAQEFSGVFGPSLPFVAQMSQEDRRVLRERWEQASPEERAYLRREFQERLRPVTPDRYGSREREMREEIRQEMRERMYERWEGNGFGTGYEHRRHEESGPYDTGGGAFGGDRRGRGRR